MVMADRLKEIEVRLAELEVLRDPIWNEEYSLEQERDRIYNERVREIALTQRWCLNYDDRRNQFYLDLDYNKKVVDEIYKYTGGFYHHSFDIFKGKDVPEDVRLNINDGEVMVWFNSIEMFKNHISKFNVDYRRINQIKKELREKLDILEKLK